MSMLNEYLEGDDGRFPEVSIVVRVSIAWQHAWGFSNAIILGSCWEGSLKIVRGEWSIDLLHGTKMDVLDECVDFREKSVVTDCRESGGGNRCLASR